MSEQLRESLSALMDDEANELEVQRLLRKMAAADDLCQTWVRYHVARDALKGQSLEHRRIGRTSGSPPSSAEPASLENRQARRRGCT